MIEENPCGSDGGSVATENFPEFISRIGNRIFRKEDADCQWFEK